MNWIKDRWQPLLAIALCMLLAAAMAIFGSDIVSSFAPSLITLAAKDSPAGVSGSDLLSTMLGISALTIGGCFAYLCLPSDRLEVRISTHTKTSMYSSLIDESKFLDYYDGLSQDDMTPSSKVIRGLLFPKSGLGGWHGLEDADLKAVFGPPTWKTLSRFVDKHLDAAWLSLLVLANIVGVCLALICLGVRYLGLVVLHFNPYEAAVILYLSLMNISTVLIISRLFVGGLLGESAVKERINVCMSEIRPGYQGFLKLQRNSALSGADFGVAEAVLAAPAQPAATRRATNGRRPRQSAARPEKA